MRSQEREVTSLTPKQALKLDLFARGPNPTQAVIESIQQPDSETDEKKPLTTGDYATTDGIIIDIGENLIVNAPFPDNNHFAKDTPYTLDYNDGKYWVILANGSRTEAKHLPPPAYTNRRNSVGRRIGEFISTHTDRARISPIKGCALACHFCNVPYEFQRYEKIPIDEIIDGVQIALKDPIRPAQHLLISGGTPRDDDFGYLQDVYREVVTTFKGLNIDIMMSSSISRDGKQLLNLEELKTLGISGLSINMELYNPEIAKRIMRGKYDIGRDQYLKFLKQAVDVFGVGAVRSMLMVGIEPVEDTEKAVELLAEIGVCPELSPFRPVAKTPLGNKPPASFEDQKQAYFKTQRIITRHNKRYEGKLNDGLQCIDCMHNVTMFPGKGSYIPKYNHEEKKTTYEYPLDQTT